MNLAVAVFDTVTLYKDKIVKRDGLKKEEQPLDGVTAQVERGSELRKRVTASRVLATGLFALALKKKSGGEDWLVIESPDFAWTVEVDRKKGAKARQFAVKVNEMARQRV